MTSQIVGLKTERKTRPVSMTVNHNKGNVIGLVDPSETPALAAPPASDCISSLIYICLSLSLIILLPVKISNSNQVSDLRTPP